MRSSASPPRRARLERRVDALRDVGRLLVERHVDGAGVGVEAVLRARVADLAHDAAHDLRHVERRRRRDLAGDEHEPGRDQRLARHAAHRVVGQDRIEHRVGDLVGDLVGVALGHGLRGEHHVARHRRGSLRRSTPAGVYAKRPPRALKPCPRAADSAKMNARRRPRHGRSSRRHRPRPRRAAAPRALSERRSPSRRCISTPCRRPRSCALLAVVLGVVGIRRHDRRSAAIGAGFTMMAAMLAVHGLTTPGFLVDSEYTAAVGVSGALAVPLGGAVILATLLSRPRELGLSPRPRAAADRRRRRRALLRRARAARSGGDSEHPRRAAPPRLVDRRRQRRDLRRARAARPAHVPAHAPPRRPRRRRRARLARASPSRRTCSAPSGRSASGPVTRSSSARSSSSAARSRATWRARRPSRSLRPTIDVSERGDRGGGAARRLGRAPARAARRQGHRRRASTRAASRGSPSRSAQELGLRGGRLREPRRRRAAARRRQARRCRTRSSARPGRLRAEFAVIKRHPRDGAALLGHIGGFAERAAARARPPRAPRRQRLPGRPARRRAVARGAHPRRLRRLRRAHERARLPPRAARRSRR